MLCATRSKKGRHVEGLTAGEIKAIERCARLRALVQPQPL
jgi:hypothetical protein